MEGPIDLEPIDLDRPCLSLVYLCLQAGCANARWLVPPHWIVAYHHGLPAARKLRAGVAGAALSKCESDALYSKIVPGSRNANQPD